MGVPPSWSKSADAITLDEFAARADELITRERLIEATSLSSATITDLLGRPSNGDSALGELAFPVAYVGTSSAPIPLWAPYQVAAFLNRRASDSYRYRGLGLGVLTADQAKTQSLVTAQELAVEFGLAYMTIIRWSKNINGFPRAVALLHRTGGGRRSMLYRHNQVATWIQNRLVKEAA